MPETSVAENEQDKSARLKLSEEQKSKLLAHIGKTWDAANAGRVRWMRDKEEGLKLYWGIKAAKDFPFKNCANLHVPLIRTMAETLHSNLMGSFDTEKPVSCTPVGPEDIPKSRKTEKLLNWQFTTQVDYSDMVDKLIQSDLMYGLAPAKVRYVIEKQNGKKVFDGIKVDILSPERFLYPPDAPNSNVQEFEYVMQEVPLTKSDIKKRIKSGAYDNVSDDDLDRIALENSRNERNAENGLENLRTLYSGIEPGNENPSSKYATVLEWYGNYDLDDDGIDERIMVSVVRDAKIVLKAVEWEDPFPFVIVNLFDIPGRAAGESVPDFLIRINQELDTLHNQRVDAVTVTNIPFFFFDPVAGFNPNETKLAPGLGIPTNGPPSQAVYVPTLNAVRPEMYQEEEMLFSYAERLLGAGSNTQGVMESKRVTATEIATIDRRSGIRFLTIFNRARRGIKQIFKLALELDKKYLPKEIQVRITGLDSSQPLFDTIKRDDLDGQMDTLVNGNSILDAQADKQEMMQVYQIGLTNPLVQRDPQAIFALTRDLYYKLGVKNIDAYLSEPEDEIPTNPQEEHNLFMQEEYIEPHLNENIEDHLKKHAALINSENFKLMSKAGQLQLMKHYAATERMKATLDQLKLIQQTAQVNTALMHMQSTGQMPPGMPGAQAPAPIENPKVSKGVPQ